MHFWRTVPVPKQSVETLWDDVSLYQLFVLQTHFAEVHCLINQEMRTRRECSSSLAEISRPRNNFGDPTLRVAVYLSTPPESEHT